MVGITSKENGGEKFRDLTTGRILIEGRTVTRREPHFFRRNLVILLTLLSSFAGLVLHILCLSFVKLEIQT